MEVFIVGESRKCNEGWQAYLDHIGASDWRTDAESDSEALTEMYGRSCYKSFGTELNKNITRTREGNKPYIENILKSHHGSVCEHTVVNFQICDVSRVVTHELVRHRAGTAISQESMRYVRTDGFAYDIPRSILNNEAAARRYQRIMRYLDREKKLLDAEMGLEDSDIGFAEKKEYSSATRRALPIGILTNIGWSANFRTLRHTIEMRTSRHAEEEIRRVFARIYELSVERYPNMFQDAVEDQVNGIYEIRFANSKI